MIRAALAQEEGHVAGDFWLALLTDLPPLFFAAPFPLFSVFSVFFALENGGMMSEPSLLDEDAAVVGAGGSASFSTALPAAGSGVADPDRGGSATAVVGLSDGRAGPPHAKRLAQLTMKTAPAKVRQRNACIVGTSTDR